VICYIEVPFKASLIVHVGHHMEIKLEHDQKRQENRTWLEFNKKKSVMFLAIASCMMNVVGINIIHMAFFVRALGV